MSVSEHVKCVSCGEDTRADTAEHWDGLCWDCNVQWLRTHERPVFVRGHQRVSTFRPWDEHRCIFIHIPRTGGGSVAEALFGGGGETHAPLSAMQRHFEQEEFQAYFKFTFVRNPWDRLVCVFWSNPRTDSGGKRAVIPV